ncbi:MAG: alanine racemase [Pseudolysinimonas sp.]
MADAASGARAEIDLDAFRHNVSTLAALVHPAATMLAVKADAYGHGMLPLARAALEAGATSLAVLDVPAALALRDAGITAQLFAWLHGVHTDFGAAIDAHIDLGISALWQLEAVLAAERDLPARLHLKIDTGLHRNGASPEQWPALVTAAVDAQRAGRVVVAGLWSHLADASPEADAAALAEFWVAVDIARELGAEPEVLHLAASSAGIRMPAARLDLVRFGIAAYGISPFDDRSGRDLGLTPVMAVRAPVEAVEGGVATIGVGSGDGIHPPAIGVAEVLVHGERRRITRLDVDSLSIDVDGMEVAIGDEVTVFGPGDDGEPTAEEWARWAGTIGDEIVARIRRLPRTYL